MSPIIKEYARLLRIPGLGGLSIAPAFGAISVGVLEIQQLSLLFLIGALAAIYGFVLNDYMDVKIDTLSKELHNRPLVKGTVSKNAALIICSLAFIMALIIIFMFFYGDYLSFYYGFMCIILSAIFGTLYNIYGKRIIGSDFLLALSEALLVLFGALMVVHDGALTIFTWIIFILTFNQLLYMNAVEGGIKDADHDHLMKVNNIALASGVKVTEDNKLIITPIFRAFGLGIRLFSVILVYIPFVFYKETFEPWQIFILTILVIGMLYSSAKLLFLKEFKRNNIRKLIVSQTFLRYSLVPIMLIPFIATLTTTTLLGIIYALILTIFPFLWYIVFTPLIGEKLFRPGL